ncbi:MAG: hypothetical protein PHX02_07040 [Oscillospiraceae bacterium]|nr:hypothetical protein [Oscillospiraceae bacterium]
MTNKLKYTVDKIDIKKEMENRIISRCKESLTQPTPKYKKAFGIGWQRIAATAVCGAIVLCSIFMLPNLLKNNFHVASSNTTSTKESGSATSEVSKTSANEAANSQTQSKQTATSQTQSKQAATSTTQKEQPTDNMPSLQFVIKSFGDFIPMTLDELEEYYGRKIIPSFIPQDLKLRPNNSTGICKRNEKTPDYDDLHSIYKDIMKDGEVYFDDNLIEYRNPAKGRELIIEVAKDRYPFNCIGDPTRFSKIIVCDTEVQFAHYNDAPYGNSGDMYSALITLDSVGYYISSQRLTKDEFMKVLTSIIE